MEKKIKVSELAILWGVSVNTVWSRIRKLGLTTIMEEENNREITFVIVPEEILNKYDVNKVNNLVNNAHYEEVLSVNNLQEQIQNNQIYEIADKFIEISRMQNEEMMKVNNNHNEQMRKVYEELTTYKSKVPLLEDKANREGLYLQEIADLKKVNNNNQQSNKKLIISLISVIIILFALLVGVTITLIHKLNNPTIIEKERVIETVKTVEKPVVQTVRKRR